MPKPPGAHGAEGVDQAVKQGHTPQQQQSHQHRRDKKIQQVQHPGGVLGPGGQLALYRAGHLRLEDVHGAVAAAGEHGDEHQHPHAAHPVGEAAPEQQSVAHGLHIRQDGGPGGGEAADRLEKRVGIGGDLPAEPEGQRPHRRQQHPGQGHDDVPLPAEELAAAGPGQQRQQPAQNGGHGHGGQHRPGAVLPIQKGHRQRQDQQPRLRQQDPSRHMENDAIIHNKAPDGSVRRKIGPFEKTPAAAYYSLPTRESQ